MHHGGLLFRLRQLGIQGNCLKLLTSYLNNRTQYVSLCDVHSDKLHTNFGVPPGSILGPLLFSVFVNDIHENIQSDIKLFADDTTLLYSAHDAITTCKLLNEDLQQINIWSSKLNFVKFNSTKFVILTLNSVIKHQTNTALKFDNVDLREVDSYTYLGLTFNKNSFLALTH